MTVHPSPRLTEVGTPAAQRTRRPNLVLAGVTKAGTTSLVQYLGQHPDISTIPGKGADHFTPLRFGPAALPPIEEYFAAFAGLETPWVLDGSITYFNGGPRLVDALHDAVPDARILVILREPAGRLWSAYKMKRERGALPPEVQDMRDFVAACQRLERSAALDLPENVTFRTWSTGMYADHLVHWWAAFGDAVHVMFLEDLAADPGGTMADLFTWLGIDPGPAAQLTYAVRNKSVEHRHPVLRQVALRTFRANWSFLVRHQRLTSWLGRAYRLVNAREFRETFPPDVREAVVRAYRPANARLAAELRARGREHLPAWLEQAV